MNDQNIDDTNSARTVIYARNNNHIRLAHNIADARDIARLCGLTVADADIFADCASGEHMEERAGLQALLDQITCDGVSHLIVTEFDRLTRNYEHLCYILRLALEHNVLVVERVGMRSLAELSAMTNGIPQACNQRAAHLRGINQERVDVRRKCRNARVDFHTQH